VGHVFLPLEYSCWSSGVVGRWIGRSPHAQKGGGRGACGRLGRESRGQVVGRAGWKPRLGRERLMQHGLQPMNPLMRMRWRHPKELSLPFLGGILCHIGQDEEPFVGHGGEGTALIRTLAAARAGLPSNGAVLHRRDKRVLERGEQSRAFCFHEAGHRS
jgi:hypothetical protein